MTLTTCTTVIDHYGLRVSPVRLSDPLSIQGITHRPLTKSYPSRSEIRACIQGATGSARGDQSLTRQASMGEDQVAAIALLSPAALCVARPFKMPFKTPGRHQVGAYLDARAAAAANSRARPASQPASQVTQRAARGAPD
ncbi:hypothetical protein HETIRDRAFT_103040 [Heterobasidion irregulare TC 32-1]|uniref:Uncharacterized protein n=1 Tax=Heterobasidion irregulare (strain TC 32-1) TaxID=747525 RepID=W4KFH9_HETIT|nr:uncharacterized protein HETIRDRAFT_103040 [Heterobasidion irregulare TC 32-1]ETW84484.1 hypothetical protein HETIRDRAFT_103040 [Heterobasidion irregulare TC 32-1]